MLGLDKLEKALLILEKKLSIFAKLISFEPKLARVHITLRDNTQIFIRYNNHSEYSYTTLFSKGVLDRCRFDNYDDKWEVSTRPHHFHPRYKKEAILSRMNGNPEDDMPYFCSLIKSGKIMSLS